VGSVDYLDVSFVIFFEEELIVFGFLRGEYEKNFENHCFNTSKAFKFKGHLGPPNSKITLLCFLRNSRPSITCHIKFSITNMLTLS